MISDKLPTTPAAHTGPQAAHWKKPRLAVVSPFLDKSHGTERMVIEWMDRLAETFDIHIYTQSATDLDSDKLTIHRIPKLPGPHLFNYIWWFAANHLWRRRHARAKKLNFDLIYSPGINCLDADAITVHIVFAEFVRQVRQQLEFRRNHVAHWPLLLHRRLYYRLIMFLERKVFLDPRTQIILTAPQTAAEICRFFGRKENFPVLPPGIDHAMFSPAVRSSKRSAARESLGVPEERLVILLIGNDWRKKGLFTLLDSLCELSTYPIDLYVVGGDDPKPFMRTIQDRGLDSRVRFLPPRKDVDTYYAAADAYAAPSIEDTFALPVSEAMACGLPVIVSARAGAAAIVTDRIDALVLNDPTDAKELAGLVRLIYEDPALRQSLSRNAAVTASKFTWKRSAAELGEIFRGLLLRKGKAFVFGSGPGKKL